MGEFVRSRSKIWWGKYHAGNDNDNDDDVEDYEDWRLGVASCYSANNSFSDSDRGSSGSPESHNSQDSGFSDSENNSSSGKLSLTKIPRPSLLSKKNPNNSKKTDQQTNPAGLLNQEEEKEEVTKDQNQVNEEVPEETINMGKIRDMRLKDGKLLKPNGSSSFPLRDIKNTLEGTQTSKQNFGTTNTKSKIEESCADLRTQENLLENRKCVLLNQNDENIDNFLCYQDKSENKQKFNYVVKELKSTLNDDNCRKSRRNSVKDEDNVRRSDSPTSDDDNNKRSNYITETSNLTYELNGYNLAVNCRLESQEPSNENISQKSNTGISNLKHEDVVKANDSVVFKVPETIPSTKAGKNGTKPKFKLNSMKNFTKYFEPNRSLDRNKFRKSQISESSVRKLFLTNDPNRSLEQTRVLRSHLKNTDDVTDDLSLNNSVTDKRLDSSSDSSCLRTEETARFVGDVVTSNAIDSSTWSIPGPPTHCSTPKSSSSSSKIPQESLSKATPKKLNFDEPESLLKDQSINRYHQLYFDDEDNHTENQPLNHWLKEIRFLYEPECMTTLQSKSLTADLNSQVTIMAAVTTEAVRTLQFRTKLISTEFSKLYRQVESGVLDHVGPLVQNLVGHVTEFLDTCNTSVNDKKLLLRACDRLRIVADSTKIDQNALAIETTNLGKTFTYCVDMLLLEQVKVLMAVLDEPASPILLLTALSSLTGLGLEGQHLSQLIARCPGGIRAILTICIDSRNVSVRSAALRTLATVCCSSHTIRQLEQAGGVEILSEILQDDSRSEMELSEAVSVIVQITAPWVEDNHSVLGLSQQLVPLVSSITRIVNNTTSSSTLLLCAAALCHLSQLEPQCIWTMLDNSTAGTLLLAIRRQGPFSPVFLREQAAGLLANMAAVPEARAHLAEHRAVVALLCFLQVRHSPLQSSAEVAAAERLQHKSAIALSRLCTDPAVAAQVVELQGVNRLVRLCREERERNHSDGVLVACLAALRKIVANCGTKSVEELNALELVEPRLLDSFLIYSSRQESYV